MRWSACGQLFGLGLVLLPHHLPGTRSFFAKYAPAYLRGLGVTLSLVAISIVLGAILSRAGRLCAHVEEPGSVRACLWLCLFLPRHAAAGADLPGLLRRSARSGRSSRRSACGASSATPSTARVFAFSLNTAAYQAEILRGAIESVPKGQWEGAASLGLHKLQTLRKIILPQALIVALRPYGNEMILMIKGSAIVAIITVYDLMGETRLRLFAHLRLPDLYLGRAHLSGRWSRCCATAIEWIERRITVHLKR